MKKVLYICVLVLTLFSCSKDDLDFDTPITPTTQDEKHHDEEVISPIGVYYLDVPYDNGCDTILAFIGDKDMVIYRSYKGGTIYDYVTVQYSLSENKIQFGTDLVDALETLYIQEIHSCQGMVEYFKGKDEYAELLEFFTNRLNKVANERKVFINGFTIWDISLVGDLSFDKDSMRITIHGNNGLDKTYNFVKE